MKLACLIALAACGGAPVAPAAPAGPPTEACVKAFVARDLGANALTQVRSVPRAGEPHFVMFESQWGEAHDCESGCFYSRAQGVALSCDRIGWFAISDYEDDHRTHTPFVLTAGDTILLDDRLWDDASRTSDRFVPWIAKSPGAPADVRAKAKQFRRGAP